MPIVIEAVPPLLALCLLIVALGIVVGARVIVEALFLIPTTTVGWVPWLGGKVKAPIHTIEKRVVDKLSAAAIGIEGAISQTWHVLAYLVEQTGAAIWDATKLAAHVNWLVRVKYPLDVISYLAHKATQIASVGTKVTNVTVQKVYTTAKVATAQLARIDHRLDVIEARVAASAVAVPGAISLPFPRIGALERAWHGVSGRLGKLEHRFGRTAFAAAVATALATLGVGWARKSCAKRTADGFCRVDPSIFEGLIAGLAVVVGAQSVVRFANGMLAVEDEFVSVLERMIVELGDVGE